MSTFANECRKAALDGITALLTGGNIWLATSADAELAVTPISSIGAASTASPSVAVLTMGNDTTPTPGTIAKFAVRTSGNANRISGSVGVGTGDLQVTDNVVPSGATEVSWVDDEFTITLQLS